MLDLVYRVIDTETTGLEPGSAAVCEVAFRDITGRGAVVSPPMSTLVNPGHPIPAEASAIHHIVDADVVDAPSIVQAVRGLALYGVAAYVAHNAEFDSKFLPMLTGTWICTHRMAKHLFPGLKSHSNNEVRYHLAVEVDAPKHTASHRAAADVAVTAAIFAAMLPMLLNRWPDVSTPAQLAERVAAPCKLHRVPFKGQGYPLFSEAETSLLEWILNKQAGGPDCIYSAREELHRRFPPTDDDGRDDGLPF